MRKNCVVSFYESFELLSSQRLRQNVIKYLPDNCFEVLVDTAVTHFVTCD